MKKPIDCFDISDIPFLIKDMDVPEMRREINDSNLRWMQRNLGIRNYLHENFPRVMMIIKRYISSAN